ncbi:MAG: HlyD family type I secretion periplasmic adaptor subunit [Dokdonella sp.]|nr:HlyD family type I secretion periplasmic adaptor subunit [Dokdonella sp.]
MSKLPVPQAEWYANVPRSTKSFTTLGFGAIAVSVVGFGFWASTALIAGAIVANGAFVATGENKTIQHLEGGVIQRIVVAEGDIVEPGQTLIELEETGPAADLRRLLLKRIQAAATAARLTAEMEEKDELIFSETLRAEAEEVGATAILRSQQLTFDAARRALRSEIATHREGIKALERRIEGGETQLKYVHEQLALLEEELSGKGQLLGMGLVKKPEVLAVRRAFASLQGEVGRLNGEIGDAKERIARTQEQIMALRNASVKNAVERLQEVNADLHDVTEKIRSAQAVLDRVTITAPVKGVVVKLNYHTPGGVIQAGKSIMEIVPLEKGLVIEARVRPQDIDSVKRGADAEVRLTALNQRQTPMIKGKVIYVSADSLADEQGRRRTGGDAYVIRVKLDSEEAAKSVPGFSPTPGMPADVYVKTTERTFFEYLTKPIRDSMSRAFRES